MSKEYNLFMGKDIYADSLINNIKKGLKTACFRTFFKCTVIKYSTTRVFEQHRQVNTVKVIIIKQILSPSSRMLHISQKIWMWVLIIQSHSMLQLINVPKVRSMKLNDFS